MSHVRRGRMASDDYMTLSRKFARDSRLSLKARGLGAWLFSHTDGWNLSIRTIAKQVGAGVEAVQSGLKELEEFGYLTREQPNEAGRFGDMNYVVTDIPDDVSAGQTEYGKAVCGPDRDPVRPADGDTGDRVSDTHKETSPKDTNGQGNQPEDLSCDALFDLPGQDKPAEDETVGIPPDAPTFDDFWAAYPRDRWVEKKAARAEWDKALREAKAADRAVLAHTIVDGAKRYAKERAGQPTKFTKQPRTWLHRGCWEDEPGANANVGTYKPYRDEDMYPGADPWFKPEDLVD